MDKETLALVEDVRQSLVDFGKQQTGSALKKTRKITSQIIWEPGPYLDELDNILSSSKTKDEAIKRIRSLVRSSEEAALRSMTLLPDDTGHHIVQSRTGGDALTELPYQRSGPIIQGLSEKHQMTFGNTTGPGSNLPAEMSLSNYAHKADDRATGLERQSGIGKNPDRTTTAHPRGTAGSANLKGVDLTDDVAIAADLDRKVTEQIQAAQTAALTDAPRQAAVREIIPGAYQGTVRDIATSRALLTPANTPGILNTYKALMRSKTFGALLPGIGVGFGAVDTAERTAKAAETKDPIDSLQAGLAAAGMTPLVGAAADASNIVIDTFRWLSSPITRQKLEEGVKQSFTGASTGRY